MATTSVAPAGEGSFSGRRQQVTSPFAAFAPG